MTQLEIEEFLISNIAVLQQQSGRAESAVTAMTSPLDDLDDFDSLNGVEITVEIMEEMEKDFKFNNVFLLENKTLTIKEAAKRLFEAAKTKK